MEILGNQNVTLVVQHTYTTVDGATSLPGIPCLRIVMVCTQGLLASSRVRFGLFLIEEPNIASSHCIARFIFTSLLVDCHNILSSSVNILY
jgi:hypothetical protein